MVGGLIEEVGQSLCLQCLADGEVFVEQSDFKAFLQVALSARAEDEVLLKAVKKLVNCPGWQTMVTFANEAAGSSGFLCAVSVLIGNLSNSNENQCLKPE